MVEVGVGGGGEDDAVDVVEDDAGEEVDEAGDWLGDGGEGGEDCIKISFNGKSSGSGMGDGCLRSMASS